MNITSWALLAIGTILVFVGVFRKELSKKEWCDKRAYRLPFIENIEKVIKEYRAKTGKISEDNSLYELGAYTQEKQPDFFKLLKQIGIDNLNYAILKADNISGIKGERLEIENTLGKIGSKRFSKLVRGMYNREHIARSYTIFLAVSRKHCTITPAVEKRILRSKSIGAFEKYMEKIYAYIAKMKVGDDLG